LALNRQAVIVEALKLVDSEGLDAVTLRALAARLGVQAPTLYWHVRNKAELLDALGDAIMDEALASIDTLGEVDDWQDWLAAAVTELRRAMLAHPDGARIVSSARSSLRRADFTERAMAKLVAHGVPPQRARLTVIVAERYTVGYVLEEQSPPPPEGTRQPDPAELTRRLPTITTAIVEYYSSGHTAEDLFQDGVRVILDESR
jgi:TetR/AcrR family transcriptional regulator, tetracycline repressor protein